MHNTNFRNLHRQRGVSKFGLLMLLALITGFLTAGLKVGPLCVDHNLITGICQELIDNGETTNMTVTEVRDRVSNSLRINNVTGFELSNIRLRKENGAPIITVAYERRVELIANLDVLAKFDSTLQ
ncbi:MAG: DUF4845 domain-containing protein [Gammaproteobacteria bacterium]|jgi:hypothetical protein|nr:DUF4845 domain-containing protein [Gammaproteobacteria bacterium]MDP6734058.1 DUF4845 domain-containing protein [Gammaproteobacteria bacterium]|tara:strand:- start:159 stop:536 length:378 start_codon:yes stop_codon:yes gene_type:complete